MESSFCNLANSASEIGALTSSIDDAEGEISVRYTQYLWFYSLAARQNSLMKDQEKKTKKREEASASFLES